MRLLGLIIFLLFGSFPQLFSQDFYNSSYYPLGIGNQWTYSGYYYHHDVIIWDITETILDSTRINGLLYYGLTSWGEQPAYWLREDNNCIYLFYAGDSTGYLLFDFNADTGDSWELPLGYECSFGTRITLSSKEDTIITPADTFYNCYRFDHYSRCNDAGIYRTWFVKGIGKVRYVEESWAGVVEYNLSSYTIVPLMNHQGQSLIKYSYQLYNNYPNPFNPTTSIGLSVPQSGLVTLTVYDVLGREVEIIFNQQINVGHHTVLWNAGNVPSGIYFVRMESQDFTQVRKVTVLR